MRECCSCLGSQAPARATRDRLSCSESVFFTHNDGVHRVAAGGCSKNRKPAGRNSGATLCYASVLWNARYAYKCTAILGDATNNSQYRRIGVGGSWTQP